MEVHSSYLWAYHVQTMLMHTPKDENCWVLAHCMLYKAVVGKEGQGEGVFVLHTPVRGEQFSSQGLSAVASCMRCAPPCHTDQWYYVTTFDLLLSGAENALMCAKHLHSALILLQLRKYVLPPNNFSRMHALSLWCIGQQLFFLSSCPWSQHAPPNDEFARRDSGPMNSPTLHL